MLQKARGTFVPAEQFNSVVDEVNRLSGILSTLGPGLELVGGRGLALNLNRSLFGNPDCPRKVLACTFGTQDTDTWLVETDGRDNGNGLEVQVVTDAKYSAGVLTVRTRTLKADKFGRLVSATAESALTTIMTLSSITREVVTDVEYNTGTHVLTHDKRTLTILGTEGAEATDTVDTLEC